MNQREGEITVSTSLDKVGRDFDDEHKFKARKADENQSRIAI